MEPMPDERARLVREPNFRWLMAGAAISALGDQFTMIALPWLVLTITGSPLTMGLVIALMSVPRALFILLGGALVDRYSPKSVLMMSKHANTILLGVLAAMVFTGEVRLPLLCAVALGIGLASAFSIPAGTSIMPTVVAPERLQTANGVMMGLRQASMLAGPLLAGLLFVLFGDGSADAAGTRTSMHGIGFAFAFDALSFLVSAWTLSRVVTRERPVQLAAEPVLRAVGAGMAMVWNDIALRSCMLYWGLCALVVGGSLQVALPVLASTRMDGATSLSLMVGVHGAGTLLGMLLTGRAGRFRVRNFGTTVLVADMLAGAFLIPLGGVSAAWQAGILLLPVGMLAGFMQVAVFSWIQQRVPRAMLGRAMSIFMFIFMGMVPLSAALTGWLMTWIPTTWLFAGAGLGLVIIPALAYLLTPMRHITEAPRPDKG